MKTITTTKNPEEAQKIVDERPDCRTAVGYSDGTVRVFEPEAIERIVEVRLVTEPLCISKRGLKAVLLLQACPATASVSQKED